MGQTSAIAGTLASWQLIAGGLVLAPFALAFEGLPPHFHRAQRPRIPVARHGRDHGGHSLWFRGIERLPVSRASILALLSPVVATAAGWLIAHQTLKVAQIIGAGLVLAAVWIQPATRSERRDILPDEQGVA